MIVTNVYPEILRAAIIRNGVWFIDQNGNTTDFYHNCCYTVQDHKQGKSFAQFKSIQRNK
jgi:hypothetical protein